MKTLTKISLAALSLAACSLVQADTATSSIQLSLTIPKLCTIDNPTKNVVVPTSGAAATAAYKVTCNTGYTLTTSTANYAASSSNLVSGSNKVPTLVVTRDPSGKDLNVNDSAKYAGSNVDTFTMSVKAKQAVSAIQTAGSYKDTYSVLVTY